MSLTYGSSILKITSLWSVTVGSDSDNYPPNPSSPKNEFTALPHSKHAEACNYLLVIICVYIDV